MITETSNNEVFLIGRVDSELTYSHEVYGEGFYSFYIKILRLSNISDRINVTVSERLLKSKTPEIGEEIEVYGQFRSYNNYYRDGNRLILTVFARDISTDIGGDERNPNQIYLNGFICKPPLYRTTPFGREICDMLLAVNRAYNKSDYIPCITWGRNARFSSGFEVGDNVRLWGRVQSRDYQKKISEDECVTKTAYEVSVSKMEHIRRGEENDEENV